MSKIIKVPRGTADHLPNSIGKWRNLENKARNVIESYGYREIRTPIFEDSALFKRSLGQTSDVVNKQLLELAGDKKEGFALRPEGTAAVVRSYIENGFSRIEQLSKLYYIGPMFRGERPQKGRLRQFHQIGVEALGSSTSYPYLDAEMIALSVNLLKSFGLTDFKLKINTLGSKEDKAKLSEVLRDQLATYQNSLCQDCQSRIERNVFRVLDCKNNDCQKIVEQLSFQEEYLSEESQKHYKDVKEALRILEIDFEESSNLVRGLDYYTHTVFELVYDKLGSQNAVGAGGRYNHLVEELGGPKEVDACGFALGMERILLALEEEKSCEMDQLQTDVFVITFSEQAYIKGFKLVNDLRAVGIQADMNFKQSSMKSQMRWADKLGVQRLVIIGEEELATGFVVLKDMKKGEQEKVSFEELISKLK